MKAKEIRELTLKELKERIENEESYVMKQRLNHAISPLDNPLKLRHARRNVARLKTILKQKVTEESQQKS